MDYINEVIELIAQIFNTTTSFTIVGISLLSLTTFALVLLLIKFIIKLSV